jgi:hypothetical protein
MGERSPRPRTRTGTVLFGIFIVLFIAFVVWASMARDNFS